MFYKLPLQIQTIEGALQYKIAPLTPPKYKSIEQHTTVLVIAIIERMQ